MISIITPSFNQAAYLEQTLQSVLAQAGELEYMVLDGGSSDGSADTIRRYAHRFAWWRSEGDAGHYPAIDEGFARTTGGVMAWLNSDDIYTPWCLKVVAEIFDSLPQVEWLTTRLPMMIDGRGVPTGCQRLDGFSRDGFLRGECLPNGVWGGKCWIQQESTFWRRSLWEKAGGKLDTRWKLAADFDLWARFFKHAGLYSVDLPLACFRVHSGQKTDLQYQEYCREADAILREHGGRPYSSSERFVRQRLMPKLPGRVRKVFERAGYPEYRRPIVVHSGRNGRWVTSAG